MTRPTEFRTADIDLSAAIMTATGNIPTARPGTDLVEFCFDGNETVHIAAVEYAAGGLKQDVKKFAANRAWLYRKARDTARTRGVR